MNVLPVLPLIHFLLHCGYARVTSRIKTPNKAIEHRATKSLQSSSLKMSNQNVQPRRPHTTKDEDSITTESKRSSKPHDLEKGDTPVLPYSNEHEKEFSNIQRDPTLESKSDTDNQLGVVKHRVVRRHWVSICLRPRGVLPTEHISDTCDHVYLDLLRCLKIDRDLAGDGLYLFSLAWWHVGYPLS